MGYFVLANASKLSLRLDISIALNRSTIWGRLYGVMFKYSNRKGAIDRRDHSDVDRNIIPALVLFYRLVYGSLFSLAHIYFFYNNQLADDGVAGACRIESNT